MLHRQRLRSVSNAAKRRLAAEEQWQNAIREAAEAGFSTREIAVEAGTSHTTVATILKATGERQV